MKSFVPPKLNLPVLWFTDFSLPLLLKIVHNMDAIQVSEEDRKVLKSFKKERLILVSNHPSVREPPVVYYLANIMGSRFYYMASREVFEWGGGLVGQFIQSIGAYSVIAGTNDKDSLKTTREILKKPGGKLALFPEGEPTSNLNDTLLPFQPGIAQIGFWGLEDAMKEDKDARIFILPCFIKYRFNSPIETIRKDIDLSLENLENKLGLTKLGKTIVERFQLVGRAIIERTEREFGVEPEPDKDFNFRLGRLRHVILDSIASRLQLSKYDKNDNSILKLRKILSFLELAALGLDTGKDKPPSPELAQWARKTAQRVYDSIGLKIEYIQELPSAERLYEWLNRFETEVFGETKYRPHYANVRLAKVINLREEYDSYKKDKKSKVQEITDTIRNRIETLMQEEIQKTQPLFPEGYKF